MKDRWQIHKAGETVEWPTPPAVYRALDAEFHFTLDPCPLGGSENGLSSLFKSWRGETVFCNPPYGTGTHKWLRRGPEADLAVFLIPSRTDTAWFHRDVLPHAWEIRFVRGRLKFGQAQNAAPFASMIVIFRGEYRPGPNGPMIRSWSGPNETPESIVFGRHGTQAAHKPADSGAGRGTLAGFEVAESGPEAEA